MYLPLQKPCDPFSLNQWVTKHIISAAKKNRCGTWKYLFCDLQNEVLGSFLGFTNPPYGCFLKWWYPQNTPKWSFLVGKPMGLLGNYHHFRSCPHRRLQGTYINAAPDLRFHLHWWARTDLYAGKNEWHGSFMQVLRSNKSKILQAVHNVHIYSTSCFCKFILVQNFPQFQGSFWFKNQVTRTANMPVGRPKCTRVGPAACKESTDSFRSIGNHYSNSYSWKQYETVKASKRSLSQRNLFHHEFL